MEIVYWGGGGHMIITNVDSTLPSSEFSSVINLIIPIFSISAITKKGNAHDSTVEEGLLSRRAMREATIRAFCRVM